MASRTDLPWRGGHTAGNASDAGRRGGAASRGTFRNRSLLNGAGATAVSKDGSRGGLRGKHAGRGTSRGMVRGATKGIGSGNEGSGDGSGRAAVLRTVLQAQGNDASIPPGGNESRARRGQPRGALGRGSMNKVWQPKVTSGSSHAAPPTLGQGTLQSAPEEVMDAIEEDEEDLPTDWEDYAVTMTETVPTSIPPIQTSTLPKAIPSGALQDPAASRKARFDDDVQVSSLEELTKRRLVDVKRAIANNEIADPDKPQDLDAAINMVGTCMDMCPWFQRESRMLPGGAVDPLEKDPVTKRADRARLVKAYERPTQRDTPVIPSDVRPPEVLRTTLDYLIHNILAADPGLSAGTHSFLRDRTRSIRQDFTYQNSRGAICIECHQRIARFHIYALHTLRGRKDFTEQQEKEQLQKVLQSLMEFYDDARHSGVPCPNEVEFRTYYLALHLHDDDTIRQVELLPEGLFLDPQMQHAIRIHSFAQRNNEKQTGAKRPPNSEASLNAFTRFFKAVRSPQTNFFLACMLEMHFGYIRKGALKAIVSASWFRRDGRPQSFNLDDLTRILGFDSTIETIEACNTFGLPVEELEDGTPILRYHRLTPFEDNRQLKAISSQSIVGAKKANASVVYLIDGPGTRPAPATLAQLPPTQFVVRAPVKPFIQAQQLQPTKSRLSLADAPPLGIPPAPSTLVSPAPDIPAHAHKPSFSFNALAAQAPAPPQLSASAAPSTPSATASRIDIAKRPTTLAFRGPSDTPIRKDLLGLDQVLSPTTPVSSVTKTGRGRLSSASYALKSGAARKAFVQSLVASSTESMFSTALESCVRQAATEAVVEIREKERAERKAKRSRIVEAAVELYTHSLLNAAVEGASTEVACEIAVERSVLRRFWQRWRRTLRLVRDAKESRKYRLSMFDSTAREIGAGRNESLNESAIESRTVASIKPLDRRKARKVYQTMGVDDEDPFQEIELARAALWSPSTLLESLQERMDALAEDLGWQDRLQYSVVISVAEVASPTAQWYRCKLGIPPGGDTVTSSGFSYDLDIRLVDGHSARGLSPADVENVNLVIFDHAQPLDSPEPSSRLRPLRDFLKKYSSYESGFLFVTWLEAEVYRETSQAALSEGLLWPRHRHLSLDLKNVDEEFRQAISEVMDLVPNQDLSAVSARVAAKPFVDEWWMGVEKSMGLFQITEDPQLLLAIVSTHVAALGRLLGLFGNLFPGSPLPGLRLPAFGTSGTIRDALEWYFEDDAFEETAQSAALFETLRIFPPLPDDQLARYFLENLGDAAEQSLEGLHAFQQDIGSIIPGMFDQYRMYLAESFESLRRMVHAEYEGEVWRKRRRGERSSDLSPSPAKKSKMQPLPAAASLIKTPAVDKTDANDVRKTPSADPRMSQLEALRQLVRQTNANLMT